MNRPAVILVAATILLVTAGVSTQPSIYACRIRAPKIFGDKETG